MNHLVCEDVVLIWCDVSFVQWLFMLENALWSGISTLLSTCTKPKRLVSWDD